ncbi:MAG: hypothetical protein HY706_03410 [Candidatus Hydrogenedentes bacterium]|nr:hypothetical protein [Candidatus Hydrogenedentota bacterium]
MADDTIVFDYHFLWPDQNNAEVQFRVELDAHTLDQVRATPVSPPEWTRLDVNQCRICPLDSQQCQYCPVALSLSDLVEHFNQLLSYARVETTVTTKERTIVGKTTVQKALSSLIGLKMATSGCPILSKLKPMARFHLPFATRDETIFRSAGAYLLAQYFLKKRGGAADLDLAGLSKIYDLVHAVNVGLAQRLRSIAAGDAHINAIVLLDLFAQELPYSIEDNLAAVEYMFAPYFESADRPAHP